MQDRPEKADKGWQKVPHSYTVPAIKHLLPKDRYLTVLDVGCGTGYVTNQLAVLGHNIIGIDNRNDRITVAREIYPKVHFEVYSAYDDLRDLVKEADAVIATEVIEHLFQPQAFLQNAFNVLRPGGYLILTTPYHGYLKNLALSLFDSWDRHFDIEGTGGHIKFFSMKVLTKMLNDTGYKNIIYHNAGRRIWLWRSMACRAEKPEGRS